MYLEILNQLNQLETWFLLVEQANDVSVSQSLAKKTCGSFDWTKP